MALPAGTRFGPYEVTEQIGVGGILTSGLSAEGFDVAVALGAAAYFERPVDLPPLVERINEILSAS
jgi:hypothetical protein